MKKVIKTLKNGEKAGFVDAGKPAVKNLKKLRIFNKNHFDDDEYLTCWMRPR